MICGHDLGDRGVCMQAHGHKANGAPHLALGDGVGHWDKQRSSRRWLTADLHLGHGNIITYAGRPYADVDEMNHDLIDRWNSKVAPDDEVWVLGDVAMGKLAETLPLVESLAGTKHLVTGNHDRMFGCQGTKYANAEQRYLDAGFADVLDPPLLLPLVGDEHAVMAHHFPYRGDSKEGHEDRYQDQRPRDNGRHLVHGHTHGLWRKNGRMVDVGVDAWGGYPVSFETVAELFASGVEHAGVLPWTK